MDYDLTVIGAGWAGYNAALRAKELGLRVALIEREKVGGTCLNKGCIPTKALIHSAKVYSLTKKSSQFGVEIQEPRINFPAIQARKEKIVQQLGSGMQLSLKGIDCITGDARLESANRVMVNGQSVESKNILIATGSEPIELKNLQFDRQKILSSDDILNIREVPKTLLIIGGGVIGCEFASLFCSVGTQVTAVELMPQLLPGIDTEVARKLETIFKKKGIKVNINTDATSVKLEDFELALLCIGRRGQTKGLGLENIGVKIEKSAIVVDDYLRTSVPNIYAAGDCTQKIMLAHFASYQGRIAAENIAHPNSQKKTDNAVIPNCIFTDPEIATVGLSEEQTGSKGIEVEKHKFDFMGSGMARILDETEGFVKVISDKKSGEIIGASIIGPRATELISVFTLAITNRLKTSQIKNTIFAHPTISESISESL